MTLAIDVRVHPANIISANAREHWSAKAHKTAAVRQLAKAAGSMVGGVHWPVMEAAHVTVTVHPPDRRKRDLAQNLAPTIKALIDGIVDAGVLPDDDDEHVLSQTTAPGEVAERGFWLFRLELTGPEVRDG